MEDVDGVVGGLVETVDDADVAAGFGGSAEDGQCKSLAVHYLRAAEREDQAARRNGVDGGGVQPLIGAQGIGKSAAVLGKGGSTIIRS